VSVARDALVLALAARRVTRARAFRRDLGVARAMLVALS
jgi:hypothetical protein